MELALTDGRCHLAWDGGRLAAGGMGRDIGRGAQGGSGKRSGSRAETQHFHSPGVRYPGGLCISSRVPSHITSPVFFLDLGMGSVSRACTTGTHSLGKDKEKPHGEERDPGQEKKPQRI